MNEQVTIEVVRLFSEWLSEIITISSGLILVLIALRERIFHPNPAQVLLNLLSIFLNIVTLAGFLAAIYGSVWAKLLVIGGLPGMKVSQELAANVPTAFTLAIGGFAAGMGSLVIYAGLNMFFRRDVEKPSMAARDEGE
jgi:hypothetical protein